MGTSGALSGSRLQVKVLGITRDLTVASGSVAYTGVGFSPRALSATGGQAAGYTSYTTIAGFAEAGGSGKAMGAYGAAFTTTSNFLIFSDAGATNLQSATLASLDADGFTLTWTKTGSPTGTVIVQVLCLR